LERGNESERKASGERKGEREAEHAKIGGEDIDLNFRAVAAGATIYYAERAVVYARARETFFDFFRQAYWNGYGRKQLTLKHGALWANYSLQTFIIDYMSFMYLMRLAFGFLGYLVAKVKERSSDFRTDDRGRAASA